MGGDEVFEDVPKDAAEPAGGEAGTPGGGAAEGFVDGDDAVDFERDIFFVGAAGSGEQLELRLDHFEAAGGGARGFELAVEGDHGPEGEAIFEVGSVEPHALDGGGSLADGHLEEWHAGGAEERGAADLTDNGGHGAGLELGDGLGVEAIFVAEGEMVEEIFDGVEVAAGELGGDALADAFDEAKGCGELEHFRDGSAAGGWLE